MSKELIKRSAALKDIERRKLQEMTTKVESVIERIDTKHMDQGRKDSSNQKIKYLTRKEYKKKIWKRRLQSKMRNLRQDLNRITARKTKRLGKTRCISYMGKYT